MQMMDLDGVPDPFPIPYLAAISPIVRLATQIEPSSKALIKQIIEGAVQEIDSNRVIKHSLQNPSTKARAARQMDIRATPDGPIIFKLFLEWLSDKNCWLVHVETGQEDNFEKHVIPAEEMN